MTIADAFNEITIAQGGTPNYSGTIASAIDALNDTLAGSDQDAAQTIEGAVRLLGQHIGGGGGTEYGALKLMTFEINGSPGLINLTIMAEEGLQRPGNVIVYAGSSEQGEYEAAAGAVIAFDANGPTDTATMTIDGGDPQSLRLIEDEEYEISYFVFTVPSEGESIVIDVVLE